MKKIFCFRITGSIIKPSHETLLDYLSYAIIILSIIGIARVIIGGHDLIEGCHDNEITSLNSKRSIRSKDFRKLLNNSESPSFENINTTAKSVINNGTNTQENVGLQNTISSQLQSNFSQRNDVKLQSNPTKLNKSSNAISPTSNSISLTTVTLNPLKLGITERILLEANVAHTIKTSTTYHNNDKDDNDHNVDEDDNDDEDQVNDDYGENDNDENDVNTDDNLIYASLINSTNVSLEFCPKHYQAYFPFVLLVEGIILLLSGIIWVKLSRVSSMVTEFYDLVQECQKSNWVRKALVYTMKSTAYMDASIHSTLDSEHINFICDDINSLLDKLFQHDNSYESKARARYLYERVQTVCLLNNKKTDLWNLYLAKTSLQCVIWFVCLALNLVMFVAFQFYVTCPEDSIMPCAHDTFLRIVWYMSEITVVLYAICNCKSIIWINKIAVFREHHGVASLCASCLGISNNENFDGEFMTCRPYRVNSSQEIINDMALMLHLLSESHPKFLPYFVVFTYDEWKVKLRSISRHSASVRSRNEIKNNEVDVSSTLRILETSKPLPNDDSSSPKVTSSSSQQSRDLQSPKSVKFFLGSGESGDEKNKSDPSSEHQVKIVIQDDLSEEQVNLQDQLENNIPPPNTSNNTNFTKVFPAIRSSFSSLNAIAKSPESPYKMPKYNSIAVPHQNTMLELAKADKVFVGGCLRPVPSSIKILQYDKLKNDSHETIPLTTDGHVNPSLEDIDAKETDALLSD